MGRRAAAAPPDLGEFPDFALRDASGAVLRRADLRGRIWVADFVSAGCPSCAARGLRMADLQTSLEKARGVALVTFVGDPGLARPRALSEYAREYGARPGRWFLLAGVPPLPEDRFVAVDAAGRIRGSFPAGDVDLAQRILETVGALLREGESGGLPGGGSFR